MPVVKHLLLPQLRRHVPTQFSWIDQRLVRDNWLPRCSHRAWTLYLFLVVVADTQGLSYYGDPAVLRHLGCSADALQTARQELIAAHLIAYQKPLYQVLALDPPRTFSAVPGRIGDLLPTFESTEPPKP
jgi:hypothetical protein